MKITELKIFDHQQFKKLELDLTYPKDHPTKAGKPLDKVCFIGQSGTGKTTILNLIASFTKELEGRFNDLKTYKKHERTFYNPNSLAIKMQMGVQHLQYEEEKGKGKMFEWQTSQRSTRPINGITKTVTVCEKRPYRLNGGYKFDKIRTFLHDHPLFSLYLRAELLGQSTNIFTKDSFFRDQYKRRNPSQSKQQFDAQVSKDYQVHKTNLAKLKNLKNIEVSSRMNFQLWEFMLQDINEYDKKKLEKGDELRNKGLITDYRRVMQEMEGWAEKNPNPRVQFAEEFLNKILQHFNLEVDPDLITTYLVFRHKHDKKEIPGTGISTGTRQLILSALPIYKLAGEETIILFDEPERSLFPDVQRSLIDLYLTLKPKAQFFFATHSPIIAAQFEPCERIILKFDEQGNITHHKGIAPEGDDPNDILRKDFGMSPLMPKKGVQMYEKYLGLLTDLEQEQDQKKKMDIAKEVLDLAGLYNFPVKENV